MATKTLEFPHNLNVSIQQTDIMYTCLIVSEQAGINHPGANLDTKPFAIGEVVNVSFGGKSVIINIDDYSHIWDSPADEGMGLVLTNQHYLFFSKDNRTNMSGILGYYNLVEYRNYSNKQAEIFATGTEYVSSSK